MWFRSGHALNSKRRTALTNCRAPSTSPRVNDTCCAIRAEYNNDLRRNTGTDSYATRAIAGGGDDIRCGGRIEGVKCIHNRRTHRWLTGIGG